MSIYDKQFIFGSVFILSNKLQETFKDLDGVTIRQFMLINMIKNTEKEVLNMNELASLLGCSRQNIKQLTKSLVKKGYLNNLKSTIDKRELNISLTDKAVVYLKNNEDAGNEILNDLFIGINNKALSATKHCFELLFKNLEKYRGEK